MAAFLNNCGFTPTAGGTTDWTYSAAVTGYATPSQAGAVNGRPYKFHAFSADRLQWEIAEGNYNSATGVFARTTVLYNSSGTGTATGQSGAGTKINFSAAPTVTIVGVKEDLIAVEESNSFTTTQKTQAKTNIGLSTPVAVSEGGTGVTAIPSFQAYRNAVQTISSGSFTKLQLNTEEWDTGSYFDNATNYRFTPGVAGKYQVTGSLTFDSIAAGVVVIVSVYKNGSEVKRGRVVEGSATNSAGVNVTCLVDMNGSSDYIEFYAYHESGSNKDTRSGSLETFACGVWVGP